MKEITDRLNSKIQAVSDYENIDTFISSAKELKNGTKADLKLYLEYYVDSFSEDELRGFNDVISKILETRKALEADLKELGFDFHMDSLFRGISILGAVLEKALYFKYYLEDGDQSREELEKQRLEALWERKKEIDEYLLQEKQRTLVLKSFESVWSIFDGFKDTGFDALDVLESAKTLKLAVDKFFKEYGIEEEEMHRISARGNLASHYYHTRDGLRLGIGEQMIFIRRFLDIAEELETYLSNLDSYKPSTEIINSIEINRLKYGAKAAHLKFLEALIEQVKIVHDRLEISKAQEALAEIRRMIAEVGEKIESDPRQHLDDVREATFYIKENRDFFEFQVPSTVYGSVDLFDRWKNGEEPATLLKPLYDEAVAVVAAINKAKSEDQWDDSEPVKYVIVRSSAVYSEDGEEHTGAGIYDSIDHVDIDDFDSFQNAVIKVWESTVSDKARAYQASIGVEDEKMGVIVQPQVEGQPVQINSTKPQHPELAEMLVGHSNTPVLLRKKLALLDAIDAHGQRGMGALSEHSKVDWQRLDSIYGSTIGEFYKVAHIMENFLGRPVQLELIYGDRGFGDRRNLVQVRPLPNLPSIKTPEFPDTVPLFIGRGVGIGKKSVKRHQVAIGSSSREATIHRAGIHPSDVSDYEVVIMTNSFSTNCGHIEQQCLEQGVLMVTNDPLKPDDFPRNLPDDLVIISDGIEARIYDANSLSV